LFEFSFLRFIGLEMTTHLNFYSGAYFKKRIMVECVCIFDGNRPECIKQSRWVKKGETYHVILAIVVLPQRELAFHLSEINFGKDEYPYKYVLANRFAFKQTDLDKLLQLIAD